MTAMAMASTASFSLEGLNIFVTGGKGISYATEQPVSESLKAQAGLALIA